MQIPGLEESPADRAPPLQINQEIAQTRQLLGPVFLGVSIGIQLLLTGFVLFGPIKNTTPPAGLTHMARGLVHPEHDMGIYIVGVAVTMVLVFLLWVMGRRFCGGRDRSPISLEERACLVDHALVLQTLLAAISLVAFFILLCTRFDVVADFSRESNGRSDPLMLLLPALAAIICLRLDLRFGIRSSREPRRSKPSARALVDLLVPLLIVLTVFVRPSLWPNLSGDMFLHEQMKHWDSFGMGPTLALQHGGALATDVFAQYGLGWPITFVTLSSILPISYANMAGISLTFACIYFAAVYFFLRLLVGDRRWAACGAILGVMLQLFSGLPLGTVIWQWPSSTMMRHPFDVCLFAAILMHVRSRRAVWLFAIGAVAGLSVLFEVDTGIYLCVVVAFYWLLLHLPQPFHLSKLSQLLRRESWLAMGIILGSFIVVAGIGFSIASRGTVLHAAFWTGYLEGIRTDGFSGFSALPVAGINDGSMIFLALMLFVYLFAITFGVGRRLGGFSGEADLDILLAVMGAYGLAILLVFVNRSHPFNLYHATVPLVLVGVPLLARLSRISSRWVAWSSIPAASAMVLAILLLTKPAFLSYPSLLRSLTSSQQEERIDISDQPRDLAVPVQFAKRVHDIQSAVSIMRSLSATGGEILVLDDADTVLYSLNHQRPWSRYTSLFFGMLSEDQIRQTEAEILRRKPGSILIRSSAALPSDWDSLDVWQAFHTFLPDHYRLDQRVGGFELWRLRGVSAEQE